MERLDVVTEAAPAKINLRLRVLAREAGGHHQIETLFCAIDLADEVEVRRRDDGGLRLDVDGPDLGSTERNLAWRAAAAFHNAAGLPDIVSIRLRKRIPAGAGLGGGSSDAAATLRALSRLYDDPLTPEALREIAAGLGADVPFFLCGSPLALGWSRGDRLMPLRALPARPVLVVWPQVPIPTADAYAALAADREDSPAPPPALLTLEQLGSWEGVAGLAGNDFEPVTFSRLPELKRIRDALQDAGARPALLSGSGSALFGVFAEADARDAAASALADSFPLARVLATATAPPGR